MEKQNVLDINTHLKQELQLSKLLSFTYELFRQQQVPDLKLGELWRHDKHVPSMYVIKALVICLSITRALLLLHKKALFGCKIIMGSYNQWQFTLLNESLFISYFQCVSYVEGIFTHCTVWSADVTVFSYSTTLLDLNIML